jgi:aspartokinase/homoserine dehydrogenase 1
MQSTTRWVVHKFGGTSVAGADRYRGVATLLRAEPPGPQGVVVSAMSKVTDALLDLVARARRRDESYLSALQALLTRHRDTVDALLPPEARAPLHAVLERDGRDLGDVLRGVWLGRSASELTEELVAGYGELWSAQILCAHLRATGDDAAWIDAREVLVVHPGDGGPAVDWAESA